MALSTSTLAAALLLLACIAPVHADPAERTPVSRSLFSSTIPGGSDWKLLKSDDMSLTYRWQDAPRQRLWNLRLAAVKIGASDTRDQLVKEFKQASAGLIVIPDTIEVGPMELQPEKPGRYMCAVGATRPDPASTKPMTVKFKVALCRHPKWNVGATMVAMSVLTKTGDDPALDGFEQMIDDLVMN